MLTEVQIERYCRQIILPGIGSGGQERLLQSSVSLCGNGDAMLLCASYLAGAGVGTLAIDGVDDALAAMIARRNPDCRVASGVTETTLTVALRDALPGRVLPTSALVWGDADSARIRIARFAGGRSCLECLRPLAAAKHASENAGALGTLAALEALRILLDLAPLCGASLVSIDLVHGATETSPFPARPGCARCSQGN